MSKVILFPTDFSKTANNAFLYALALAKEENAKVIIVHAFTKVYLNRELPVQYSAGQMVSEKNNADKILKKLCVIGVLKKVKCEFINKEGTAVNVILQIIKKQKPDLVIMGTNGTSGIKDITLGSNTSKIIERSECPVIAVPEHTRYRRIRNITYATNYYESDIDALKKLTELAKLFDARIILLHVYDNEYTYDSESEYMEKFMKKIKKKIRYDKMYFRLVYGEESLVDILEKYIQNESSELISMSAHYRSLFDKIFGSSITQKIARHTRVPLLVFHHEPELSMAFD